SCNYFENWWGPNFGPQNDVSAPGVGLYTTDVPGSGGYTSGDYMHQFNGTSGATPIVSGIAGLILSVNPNLTASQVVQILKSSANDIHILGFDDATGWGRVNAYAAVVAAGSPFNDLIGNATVVGNPSTTVMDPTGSTVSAGDPPACAPYTNNVWFRYTSPIDQPITFTTHGSSYDTVLAVYTGFPAALTPLACDDDSGTTSRSWLGMYVSAGTTYYIMVGKYGATPLSGPATLSFNVSPVPTGDTLALFNPTGGLTSLVDTLQDQPPLTSYTTFTDNTPVNTP